MCLFCTHLDEVETQFSFVGWTCTAFPADIPPEILSRIHEHLAPIPGKQVGTDVYEPKKVYDFADGRNYATFDGE